MTIADQMSVVRVHGRPGAGVAAHGDRGGEGRAVTGPWRWETAWWNRRTGDAEWAAHDSYEAAMAHARELVAERHQGVVVQHVNPDTEQIRERVEL